MLEYILLTIMLALTALVVFGVIYRKAGASLSWYDEVASVLLAWLTYYGSALAALNRGHIGFNGLINAMKPKLRIPFVIFSEAIILGFFILLAWVGIDVLRVLEGDTLVSLTWVPLRLTESVIPIGAVLFIISEALGLPEALKKARTEKGIAAHDDVLLPELGDVNDRLAVEEVDK
ncbi:MAG: TRAP transporter small permease subunit [Candidatus Brocadiia bacterium]|nr:MAG: TRAP transporter small permease subunit [Candidatus Brocadiia bacterium]